MSRTIDIMKKPTMIRAGAVACAGMTLARARRHRGQEQQATTTEASPVRAPSATPAADSMYVVLLLLLA